MKIKSLITLLSFLFRFHPQGSQQSDELRRKRHEATRPNHILLFTIINPVYPITVVSTIDTYTPDNIACSFIVIHKCTYIRRRTHEYTLAMDNKSRMCKNA